MDKQIALTPFELELKAVLDVPEPDSAFVQGLRGKLLRKPQRIEPQRKSGFQWIPWLSGAGHPVWMRAAAVFILVILAIFLAVGPERVVAAAQHWLGGFIPGVGFIDTRSSPRILDGPVRAQVDGAAMMVEKGYTNSEETAVQIRYLDDSRACKKTNQTVEENHSKLNEKVYLLLPDGRKLFALTPRFFDWGKFPPLPDKSNEAVLVVPPNVIHACAVGDPANPVATSTFCQCLDDDLLWKIPLKFISPPPGSILPVVDSAASTALPIPTATAVSSEPTFTTPVLPADPAPAQLAAAQPELVGKLVALDDGYLILAALKRDPTAQVSFSFGLNERHFQLLDGAGSEIPVEELERSEVNPDVFKDFQWGDTLLLRTRTKPVSGPLTLIFPTLVQSQYQFGKEAEFSLDLGLDPQTGQRIPVQKSFDFVPGHPFSLREVTVDNRTASGLGVTLTFAGEGYETIQVAPVPFPDTPPQGGSSGQCADFPGCFYTSTGLIPSEDHQYHLAVSGEEHTVQGPWSLTFDLKEAKP